MDVDPAAAKSSFGTKLGFDEGDASGTNTRIREDPSSHGAGSRPYSTSVRMRRVRSPESLFLVFPQPDPPDVTYFYSGVPLITSDEALSANWI